MTEFCQTSEVLDFPRVDPEVFPSSQRQFWSYFGALKPPLTAFSEIPFFLQPGRLLASRGVFWAHGSSPLGPLVSFFLLRHGAKRSSSIWPLFKNPGWGRSGDRTPMCKKVSGRAILGHIFRDAMEVVPPAPHVNTSKNEE